MTTATPNKRYLINIDLVVEKLSVALHTAVLREAWATLPESSSHPLPATLAQSRNLAHASLEPAVHSCGGA